MGHMEELIPKYQGKFRSVLLFGPPGAGKGTLGRVLAHAGGHLHLSSGDVFRGLKPESPAGQLAHKYISKGHLLPDEVTMMIFGYYIEGLIATNQYDPARQLLLIDGLPRTLPQAVELEKIADVTSLIVLEINDFEALAKRIQRRALLEGRHDDLDLSVLRTRMKVYEEQTTQVLQHYPKEQIHRFRADQKPLEVLGAVLANLAPMLG